MFPCPTCACSFRWKCNLHVHVKEKHCTPVIYRCTLCEASFSRKSTLTRHHLVHNPVVAAECVVCQKLFTRQQHYVRHLQSRGHLANLPTSDMHDMVNTLPEQLDVIMSTMNLDLINKTVLDPCGPKNSALCRYFRTKQARVVCNDLHRVADYSFDMTDVHQVAALLSVAGPVSYIVSSPPYKSKNLFPIVSNLTTAAELVILKLPFKALRKVPAPSVVIDLKRATYAGHKRPLPLDESWFLWIKGHPGFTHVLVN
eukprot:Lithocolla_globosa_v1_NODE_3076_length_1771_cov_30.236597.p1 type:complete len:256 gc:universal NODE_3076_length_1771_cov_30.236597:202-969(+)